jgi:mono/diheme cytochrome c family protein
MPGQVSSRDRSVGLRAALIGLGLVPLGLLTMPVVHLRAQGVSGSPSVTARGASLQRGKDLFVRHCAVCHGELGAGDGQAAYLLSPAPRDFTRAQFRLVSTVNGAPTDQDLVATLRRGMPGSAMPAFEWMPASDLESLALHVRELALEGRTQRLLRQAEEEEEELSREEALEIATLAVTPGEPIAIGPPAQASPLVLEQGRRAFLKTCALCHGADGTGRNVEDQVNEDGTPAQPRDITAGVFKGGARHEDIARRVLAGLPGSPMPATEYTPEEAGALVAYVQSLARPNAHERGIQSRRTLAARRVQSKLPREIADPAWSEADATYLPLMPLWWSGWSDQRASGVVVRALHDSDAIAIRLSWEDPTLDHELLGQDSFTDAAALQLSSDPEAPLFTMGAAGAPVNIWQWKAAWERDLEHVRDVADLHPNTPEDLHAYVDAPSQALYRTATFVGNRQAALERRTAGEALTAEGFGTLRPLGGSSPMEPLEARGVHGEDGYWDVVFVRPLAACCEGELPLQPGRSVFFAAAVWDGSHQDRNGQKSVTVWHVLELEGGKR